MRKILKLGKFSLIDEIFFDFFDDFIGFYIFYKGKKKKIHKKSESAKLTKTST